MKVVFATGIFPPDIGGPATYVASIARELLQRGDSVTVLTYGKEGEETVDGVRVVRVKKSGGIIGRWLRYKKALRTHAHDADVIVAFSSVSAGIPLLLSGIKGPEKALRLGGDFFWERYTDSGGTLGLREWYETKSGLWRRVNSLLMGRILRSFDRLVYSTDFQRQIHLRAYQNLPPSTVEQNPHPAGMQVSHMKNSPFRLLFLGRFVRFKNIGALIAAMAHLPGMTLTIAGDGPLEKELKKQASALGARITFHPRVSGEAKRKLFDEHDLLVLPSFTEISPNVALEARSVCLPVLLTEETGLIDTPHIHKAKLRTPEEIVKAVTEIEKTYIAPRYDAPVRSYARVAEALIPKHS